MKKITKLTPEQEIELKSTYQEWLNVGRSVEPINHAAARDIVNAFYRRIGKPEPVIMTFSSPAMCILAWGVLKNFLGDKKELRDQLWDQLGDQLGDQLRGQLRDQLGDQLRGQLWDQLWGQLGDQLWGQLRDQLWDQLRDQLWGQLRDQLWGQLWGQLGDQLWGQLRDQLWGQLGGQLRGQLRDQLWGQLRDQLWGQLRDQLGGQLGVQLSNYFAGQHWCYWSAFYKFGQQIGAQYTAEQTALLDLWIREARSMHWWFPYEGIVLLSERHSVLHVDEQGRLHCEDGPACAYKDGWGIWSWHGTNVPQQVIESPETLTMKQVRDEENAEVRRVMIERMGWDRFCSEANLRVIHTDTLTAHFPALPVSETVHADMRAVTRYREGTEVAELLESDEFKDFDDRPLKFVRVTDPSTGEKYLLRVWPENKRAYEAVAQTFGLTEDQYKSSVYSHS